MNLRFRGVAQVAAFNWPKLVGGAGAVAFGVVGRRWLRRLPHPLRWAAGGLVAGAACWTPISLLASWWVYDLSPLRRWRFVADGLPGSPGRVLLVVAGFDEVSPAVRALWPDAELGVVDVVTDPEASVRRARRWFPAAVPIVEPGALAGEPAGERTYDLVLFAQSAHEIRDPDDRSVLFAAARTAVAPGGHVVLVEHLRDLPNVLAFGPGAWHFTTRGVWTGAFAAAGLAVVRHTTVTPLVHVWTLRPEHRP